jgi:galactose mutarotase-like enzyme
MWVQSTQPCVVVYTTNWVAPSDTIHRPHAAVCLETCQFPDAVNMVGTAGFPKEPWLSK